MHTQNKWLMLIMMTLVFIFPIGIIYTVMPVLFSSIGREIDLSLAQVGFIWGAFPLGFALFSLLGGLLGDRLGFYKVIGVGCFAIALANAFRALTGDFVTLALSMLLCGISLGMVMPILPKVAGVFFPQRQLGMAIGVSNAGFSVGGIIATALSATLFLPLVGSWRNVLFLYSAACVVIGIIWFLAAREAKPDQNKTTADNSVKNVPFRQSLGAVLRVKDLWLLTIAMFGLFGSYLALMGYLPTYLENTGIPKSTGDTLASTVFITGIIGTVLVPTLSDRIGSRKMVLILCSIVTTVGLYLISISTVTLLWLVIPLIGFAVLGIPSLTFALAIEMKEIGATYGGTATGVLVASMNIGGFVLPIIGGNLAETNPTWPFVFWAILCLLSVICLLWVKKTPKTRLR